jgi:hypothetical protein
MGMSVKLKMDNVQRYIDQQNKVNLKFTPKGEAADFNYGEYHDLAAVSVKLYERNLNYKLQTKNTYVMCDTISIKLVFMILVSKLRLL